MPHEISKSRAEELLAHRDAAYLLALRLMGNTADAEDAVQDAFVKALTFDGTVPAGHGLRLWFLRVVANAAKNVRLREHDRHTRERNASMSAPVEDPRQSDALRAALAGALSALTDNLRAPICLHYEQGLSYAEAAQVLDDNEGTLRANASRGIQLLRERLARAGFAVAPDAIGAALIAGLGVKSPAALTLALEKIANGALPTKVAAAGVATKVAIAFCMTAIIVLAVVSAPKLPGPVLVSNGDGAAPVSTAPPQPTAGIAKELADVLDKKMDLIYRREYLSEVLEDLNVRAGLISAYPFPADKSFLFSLNEKQVSVKQVLEKLASEGGLELEYRGEAVVFWKKADDKTLQRLATAINDATPEIRLAAATDLAALGDRRIYPLLFKQLDDKDATVVAAAVNGLGAHYSTVRYGEETEAASASLIRLVKSAPAGVKLRRVMELLAVLRTKSATDGLFAFVNDDGDATTQRQAALALLLSGDSRAATVLVEGLDNANVERRNSARDALSVLVFAHEMVLLSDRTDTDGRMAQLKCTGAIQLTLDSSQIEALSKTIDTATDGTVRAVATFALGLTRDSKVIPKLKAVLDGPDSSEQHRVHQCVMLAASIIPGSDAEALIVSSLNSKDDTIRNTASFAAGLRGTPAFLPTILSRKNDTEFYVRRDVARALSRFDGPDVNDTLRKLLTDEDWSTRLVAASSLRWKRGEDVLEPIAKFVRDLLEKNEGNKGSQAAAVQILADLRVPEAIPELFKILKIEERPEARLQAAHELENYVRLNIGDRGSIEAEVAAYRAKYPNDKELAAMPKPAVKPPAPPKSDF